MFHGHSKVLFGRDIGLNLAQNPVLSFLPWKEDQFGFSGSVNDPHVSISDMTLFFMSTRRTKAAKRFATSPWVLSTKVLSMT